MMKNQDQDTMPIQEPATSGTLDGYVPEIQDFSESSEELEPVWAEELEPPEAIPEAETEEAPTEEQLLDASEAPPIDMGPLPTEAEEPAAPPPVPQEKPSRIRRAWKERKLFIVLTTVFLLLAICVAGGISYVYLVIHPYESYDKIFPNVYCAGINLGGMRPDEAQATIEEALSTPSYSVKVILPDAEYEFCPAQEGITLNGKELAEAAYAYGRDDPSAYGMYRAYHLAEKQEYRLEAQTELVFSRGDIASLAAMVSQETEILPTETTSDQDAETHTVTITPGQPGRRILVETVQNAVISAFENMDFSDITLDYEKIEIDLTAARKVCRDAANTYSTAPVDPVITPNEETHAIELTVGTQGWKISGNELYRLLKEQVDSENYQPFTTDMTPVEPAEINIVDAYHVLACDPVEPYYSWGTVYEGEYGYTLDWDAAIAAIEALSYGDQLSIDMTPIAPKMTAAEVEAVLFRDRLGSYSSPHTANANRTNNLDLACQAINGTVINAGETFSFNSIVGERTAAKGYRSATVYVGSESKEELGGGICQVASTIYDAALYAEMEITSRASHTFFVTYVPGGLDATIYWGALDFCFRNNTDYPIRVNAYVSGGYVNISIDGTKTNDHVVKLSSTQLSSTPYGTVYVKDSSKPSGYEEETTYPYTGYTYAAYQYIYDGNGNLLDTIYLGQDTYEKRDRVITVGTG